MLTRLSSYLLVLLPIAAVAQPVIQGPTQLPQVGYTSPVSIGAAIAPGGPGANQTWDFRTLMLLTIGTQTVVAPSSTPYAATYPQANYAFTITAPQGTVYFLIKLSSDRLEQVAGGSGGSPTLENDYTPNLQSLLKFPFSFGESFTDTYQKVGDTENTITVTYDAYGTLMLPSVTYTNVVRTENRFEDGSDYTWWTVDPLIPVLTYDHNNNTVTVFSGGAAGVEQSADEAIRVFPNPARARATVMLPAERLSKGTTLRLVDARGEIVREVAIEAPESVIELEGLAGGSYVYEISNPNAVVTTGTLIVE